MIDPLDIDARLEEDTKRFFEMHVRVGFCNDRLKMGQFLKRWRRRIKEMAAQKNAKPKISRKRAPSAV